MFFWDVVVVVEGCPCGPFFGTFTQYNSMGVLKLPIGDTPVALHSFPLLHTAAEALPSFLLFLDFLPGSQVHRDYSWKIYMQCTLEVSVLRNYMGLTVLQSSYVLLGMKILYQSTCQYGSIF